jgi:Zn-finger nucleic acid-binding protein
MSAGNLRCPGCGAPAGDDLTRCTHCSSALATVACPACFGRLFRGTRHCPHCGAAARLREAADGAALRCPDCGDGLAGIEVGGVLLHECGGCHGSWVAADRLDEIVTDRERQAAVLAFPDRGPRGTGPDRVRYRPCPECGALMHRMNFQRISGVILDVCRDHGSWFDPDELRRIVEFVRGGGLDVARARERAAPEDEQRRLEAARLGHPAAMAGPVGGGAGVRPDAGGLEVIDALAALFGAFFRPSGRR